jgi:hypothetical protein
MNVASSYEPQVNLASVATKAITDVTTLIDKGVTAAPFGQALIDRLEVAREVWVWLPLKKTFSRASQSEYEMTVMAFNDLRSAVSSVPYALTDPPRRDDELIIDELHLALTAALDSVGVVLGVRLKAMTEGHADDFSRIRAWFADLDAFKSSMASLDINERARRAIDLVESARAEVTTVRDEVRVAAGDVASDSLSEHFESLAKTERGAATRWRLLAVVILTLVVAVAGALQLVPELQAVSWLDLVRKYAIVIPATGLAAYSAKQSSDHRKISRWAAVTSVQLRTISPFTRQLEGEVRSDLIHRFGHGLFQMANHPIDISDRGPSGGPFIGINTEELLEHMTALVKSTRS